MELFMAVLFAVVGAVLPPPIEIGLMVTRQATRGVEVIETDLREERHRSICCLARQPFTWALES